MSTSGLLTALLATLLLWQSPVAEAAAGHRKGDHVLFSGQVTGGDSEPLANITVLLELSRTTFSIRRFRQVKKNTLSIPVTTTVGGQYLHDWRWDGYYNTFELAVAIPVPKGAGSAAGQSDGYEILHRTDVTEQVRQGSPVVTPLVVESQGDLGWLRRLLGGNASSEELRIFHEMGQPDRVDTHDGGATAWWYFETGKVYRFRAGALEQVEHFEPIKPL